MSPRRSFERDDGDTVAWGILLAIGLIAFVALVASLLAGCGDAFVIGESVTATDAGLAPETSVGIVHEPLPEAATVETATAEAESPKQDAHEAGVTVEAAPTVPEAAPSSEAASPLDIRCNTSVGVVNCENPGYAGVRYWPYGSAGMLEGCWRSVNGQPAMPPPVACPPGAPCLVPALNGTTQYNGVCE